MSYETGIERVPAQSTQLVRETIQRAYGKKVEEVFAEFDNKPVGSASIGQVHRATLKDGSRVAVKVQYGAGNEQVMRNDIKHGKELFRWLAPEQVAVLDEVEAQFATEFDYRREASHLSQVRSNLQKAGFLGSWWRRGVVDIPEPITDVHEGSAGDEVPRGRQFGRRHPSIGGKSGSKARSYVR